MDVDFNGILIAFGGGVLGAAIGALAAFEVVGLLVIVGALLMLIGGSLIDFAHTGAIIDIAFVNFGPHVGGFASGVAAAAYATRIGKLESGRDILSGMAGINSPSVLLVGGVFGIFGFLCALALNSIPSFTDSAGNSYGWTDTVALTVVISAIVVRLIFGKTGIFGKLAEGGKRFSPPMEIRWIPWQSEPGVLLVLGVGVGIFAGSLAMALGLPGAFLAFGISALSLIFLQYGTKIPVTHHIAFPAALAALYSGNLIVAAVVGVACAFVGEFMARLFIAWGDTHIDPPAATIAPMTTLLNFLASMGLFTAL